MKFNTFILIFFLSFFSFSNAQVSVSSKHIGKAKKIKKENLDRFKNSTTIFILPDVYDKFIYEEILKESWTITPYEIININDFDFRKYLNKKYSFVDINFTSVQKYRLEKKETRFDENVFKAYYFYFNLDVFLLKNEKIKKNISKLKNNKKRDKKIQNLYLNKRENIARIALFLDSKTYNQELGIKEAYKNLDDYETKFSEIASSKNIFFNFRPGFLKNYFQKINNTISNNELYWLYGKDYLNEIKELKTQKLYMPEYFGFNFDPYRGVEYFAGEEKIHTLMEKYKFDYKIISSKELNEKIMNKENIYYARYARINTERFIQVVNALTGEIIYRDYFTGLSYNLKPKNFKRLNKTIEKTQ